MVSLSKDVWFETPGSAILFARQEEERPNKDFLMNQQGLFSGKTEGDLDSVPGYYGGTASYKWVQNAKVLNQHRIARYRKHGYEGSAYSVKSHLTPSETRIAAYKASRSMKPVLKGPARGRELKHANEFGAYYKREQKKIENKKPSAFQMDSNGNITYVPTSTTAPSAVAKQEAAKLRDVVGAPA